jgi:hypothetical protein
MPYRLLFLCLTLGSLSLIGTDAEGLGRDTQTSSSCQIGAIKKGVAGKHCEIPIPESCKVATNPTTNNRWADIEKTGGISCQFDSKRTDWKTRITGVCGKCEARQCSAKFNAYFDCAQPALPPKAP